MKLWIRNVLVGVLAFVVVAGVLFGVPLLLANRDATSDYTARFLRYENLQDGTRAGVVAQDQMLAPEREVKVFVSIPDLKSGEQVVVHPTGTHSWQQPQWWPEAQIVSRATK